MNLYDYLYVDLEKVISIYSQLTGGVVEVREIKSEKGLSSDNKRNYDFKIFKHDAGGTLNEREEGKETIKPHHALLQELEEKLLTSGYLFDLNKIPNNKTLKDSVVRTTLKDVLCVKCTGRIVIEDYERMKKISKDFPQIVQLINKSRIDSIQKTAEYQEIEKQIEELKATRGDKKQINEANTKARELKAKLDIFVTQIATIETVPQWILDGTRTWIDAFLPKIINIRVYPFKEQNDEHVFGHLESSNFMISDPTAFHYTYGSFPTEEFTMLGIVTSVPSNDEESFTPMQEFDKEELADYESIEKGFRGLFQGFEGFEGMVRTCRYPRVLVHPLLVYRQTSPISYKE